MCQSFKKLTYIQWEVCFSTSLFPGQDWNSQLRKSKRSVGKWWRICHCSNLVLSLGLNLILILIETCLQRDREYEKCTKDLLTCCKKSIFVGLFFFCNKWLGEEKKKSLKLVSSSLFHPLGISWKINISVYNASLLMKLKRWRGKKYQAGWGLWGFSSSPYTKLCQIVTDYQWIFTDWIGYTSWVQSLTNSMRK